MTSPNMFNLNSFFSSLPEFSRISEILFTDIMTIDILLSLKFKKNFIKI